MSSKKQAAPPQPKRFFLRLVRHVTMADALGQPDTAIGLSAPSGFAEYEIQDSFDGVVAALTPPEKLAPPTPKPDPKGPGTLVCPPDWPRVDADLVAQTAGEPGIREVCNNTHLHLDALHFLRGCGFDDGDTLELTHDSHGTVRCKLSVVRRDVGNFGKLIPNKLLLEPKRDWVVLKFGANVGSLDARFRRIHWLGRRIPFSMAVLSTADLSLESWHNCSGISKQKLVSFVKTAIQVGCEPKCSLANFRAAMPAGHVARPANGAYGSMGPAGLKFVPDEGHFRKVNQVIFFEPKGAAK